MPESHTRPATGASTRTWLWVTVAGAVIVVEPGMAVAHSPMRPNWCAMMSHTWSAGASIVRVLVKGYMRQGCQRPGRLVDSS
jgi:hypothetical protein